MSNLIEVSNQEFVLVEELVASTIEIVDEETLVVQEEVTTIISEGLQGIPGVNGVDRLAEIRRPAAANLSGHRIVLLDASGSAAYASNSDQTHANRIVGMTTGAVVSGASATIRTYGEITEPSWNWNTAQPVYLGVDGLLSQTPPEAPAAKFSVVVGFPISATTLFINFGIPITLIP